MTVKIHGKEYKTVAERVQDFRSDFPDWSIITKITFCESEWCTVKAIIKDDEERTRSTGIAHEVRGDTNINKTSHVENCETSAVGRALAFFNYAGSEIASADEVVNAINNQELKAIYKRASDHTQALFKYHSSVVAIKQGIASGSLSEASEAWFELDDEIKTALWAAPSKGGIFTTEERQIMQSSEFREANQ